MSNSELFLIKDDEDQVMRFKILETTSPRFEDHDYHDHHHAVAMDVPELRQVRIEQEEEKEEEEEEDREKKGEQEEDEECDVSVPAVVCKRLSLGELVKVEEDDDGFKTPTSLDNKIPAIQRCPPAPRPIRQLPMKRKSSIILKTIPQPLNLLAEFEALFPLPINVSDLHRQIKKARREDE